MKQFKLVLVMGLLFIPAIASYAVENKKVDTQISVKEPSYPMVDDRFEKVKKFTQEFMAKRKEVFAKEEICVNNAKNREDLKVCLNSANDERKSVGQEIKDKKGIKKPAEITPLIN